MSQTVKAESKSKKVQTTLAYKQTKLNLGRLGIKQTSDDTKPKDTAKPSQDKLRHNPKNDSKQAECAASKKQFVTDIPAIVTSPEIRRVLDAEGVTKIVMDLETSSQAADTEICQIAASDGKDEFNVYIIPKGYITSGASAVNKLRKKRGTLYQGKEKVDAIYLNQAITKFLAWLKMKMPCLLIAHNSRTFDAKHLVNAIAVCKEMQEFSQKVIGFSDSLTAFRERFPERKTYTQTGLAKDLLGATYNAHNALDDVRMLYKLVSKYIEDDLLFKHSFTVSWYRDYIAYSRMTQENVKSLKPLLDAGKVSEGMAAKIAGSGLTMNHLEHAYESGGKENLCSVLTDLHEGKPRVTNNKKVLADVFSFFQENNTVQKSSKSSHTI